MPYVHNALPKVRDPRTPPLPGAKAGAKRHKAKCAALANAAAKVQPLFAKAQAAEAAKARGL